MGGNYFAGYTALNKREYLKSRIENDCLVYGGEKYRLSSGIESGIYFDCKKLMLNAECLNLIADEFINEVGNLSCNPTAIGGMTIGADFITAAVLVKASQYRLSISHGSIVRKESKTYGTKSQIENKLSAGTKIVVVDDVMTTGKSIDHVCREFKNCGYDISGIIVLVDRCNGGSELLSDKHNVTVRSIFKIGDFEPLALWGMRT